MSILTAARLRELLDYDPVTGIFTWKTSFRGTAAGSVAGCVESRGYRRIRVVGRRYRASHLAWLYVHGEWPPDQLDHKDNIRDHDWIDNLRPATNAQNGANARRLLSQRYQILAFRSASAAGKRARAPAGRSHASPSRPVAGSVLRACVNHPPEAFMARKKNGAAAEPGPGHNSSLTDEERRALTLHHKRAYESADALVERAKSDRKAVSDLAKSDLGKGAMADIKDLIGAGDEKKTKAALERMLRIARWAGLPVGTQLAMFDFMPDDRAAEEGKTAGMEGMPCDPPRHWPPSAHQRWIEAWHEGQAVLASAFKKKRDETVPAAEASEAEHAQA